MCNRPRPRGTPNIMEISFLPFPLASPLLRRERRDPRLQRRVTGRRVHARSSRWADIVNRPILITTLLRKRVRARPLDK